jgi:hypothetical protein
VRLRAAPGFGVVCDFLRAYQPKLALTEADPQEDSRDDDGGRTYTHLRRAQATRRHVPFGPHEPLLQTAIPPLRQMAGTRGWNRRPQTGNAPRGLHAAFSRQTRLA